MKVNVANSFGDIASSTIWGDVSNLILGFSIVFVYVNIMLGKFNMVEQRVSKGICLVFHHLLTVINLNHKIVPLSTFHALYTATADSHRK